MRSATRKLFFYVDAASKGSQNVLTGTNVGYVVGTETEWFWNDSVTAPAQIKYTRGETVVLGVARRGDSFRFFVNGNLVFEAKNPQGFSALDSASVGFLTFNTRITITDYFLSTEIETIDEKFDHVAPSMFFISATRSLIPIMAYIRRFSGVPPTLTSAFPDALITGGQIFRVTSKYTARKNRRPYRH